MRAQSRIFKWTMLLGGVLAGGLYVSHASDQPTSRRTVQEENRSVAPTVSGSTAPTSPKRRTSPFASRFGQSVKARVTYQTLWGIDNLQVSESSSGALLRFSYRVVDAAKANALHDEKSTPYLIDHKSGAVLQVPNLPKVGELRPKITPVNGKEYWMVFSNKGFVKAGNLVDVVIGKFSATGLVVRPNQ